MQCVGRIFGQPVISGTADASDCFNQFFVHPSELGKTSILWRAILDVARSARYTHILANSFGFGGSPSSGYCQRFLNSMLHRVRHRMDAEEHLIEASGAVADASQLAYLAARRKLGHGQDRLYCCRAYTDDPYFLAVSVERWIRLISRWHDVVLVTGLRMAGAHKHQAGSTILRTGIRVLAAYGALAVPVDKRLRATRQLRRIERQERTTLEEAKSIAGLIGHVLPLIGINKADMNPLYWPHRTFAALLHNHDFTPTSSMATSARHIANAICARPGIAAFMMLAPEPASMTTAIVVISSDAAKDGTADPGIAGYMHGRSSRVPLQLDDVVGPFQISINALEFVGIYGNVVTFGSDTAGYTTLQLTDSLTSANITVAESAKAPAMELVHSRLRARTEYKRMELTMLIAHIYGPGNVISDAGSRGYFQRVDELCTQLGITHEWVPPHPSVAELLTTCARSHVVRAAAGGDAASGGDHHVKHIRTTAVRPARQWRAHRRVGRAGAEPEAAPAQRPKLGCMGARFRQLGHHRSRAHGQGHGRRISRNRSFATNTRSGADAIAARTRAVSGADDKRAR